MTEKILITGAGGFLGSLLSEKLKDKYSVIGTTKFSEKSGIKCDITNKKNIIQIIQKTNPDIIIHLAGITGNIECEKDPHKTLETNVMGTYYILDAIKNKKIRLIFASSREVYGYSKNKVNENSPLQPINLNGITKMFSENLIINFHLKYKIGFNILRFTNFYGEHNEKRGISKMIKNSLKGKKIIIFGGSQSIDLIHFDDAVNAIIKTIEAKRNGIFNIGYGKSIKLLSLIDTLEKISKTKINFNLEKSRNIEVQKFALDVSKAKRELGFEAKISPKIAIKRMVTKWKKN
jgi:UDP-glucose 4-epimerase